MAQQAMVTLVDCLDGTSGEDVETVEFGLDGVIYEIDLNEANADVLRDRLATFISRARRQGGLVDVARRSRNQTRIIRKWAKQNGYGVSDLGRIPAMVIQAFETEAAQPKRPHIYTADFYVGIGQDGVWLGSLYHEADPVFLVKETVWGRDALCATDIATYTDAVTEMLDEWPDGEGRRSYRPRDGWPWPWPDSGGTDWVYQFHNGRTWVTPGYAIRPQRDHDLDSTAEGPDMAGWRR